MAYNEVAIVLQLLGLPVALYNVGGHYFAGKGVELSFKKAADYYQKAADMGFAPAQVNTVVSELTLFVHEVKLVCGAG